MPVQHGIIRNRNFLLLWSGQTVSTLGSQTCGLALPLLVLSTTGSAASAGVVGFVAGLPPLVLLLPGGALVDRWDRRRVMVRCDVGRMGLMASIPVIGVVWGLSLAQLLITAVLHATLSVLFNLAQSAALPQVVAADELPGAIARNQASLQAATLAGQPLGGWLFGLAPTLPFTINAASFAVSAMTLLEVLARRSRCDRVKVGVMRRGRPPG